MITAWTEHLNEDAKQRFINQLHGASDVLERLAEIYKKRLSQIEAEERDFSPGWEYKEASLIGRREEIKGLLTLINLDRREK